MTEVATLWSYLAAAPLTWLTVTFVAYLGAAAVSNALRQTALANPVLLSVAAVALLEVTHKLGPEGERYPYLGLTRRNLP